MILYLTFVENTKIKNLRKVYYYDKKIQKMTKKINLYKQEINNFIYF